MSSASAWSYLHSQAVRRGAPNTFVLGCMPYQSYNTADRALVNATRFMQEAGCDAVKPQGGRSQAHILKALVDAGIPTASHIGLTPHTDLFSQRRKALPQLGLVASLGGFVETLALELIWQIVLGGERVRRIVGVGVALVITKLFHEFGGGVAQLERHRQLAGGCDNLGGLAHGQGGRI